MKFNNTFLIFIVLYISLDQVTSSNGCQRCRKYRKFGSTMNNQEPKQQLQLIFKYDNGKIIPIFPNSKIDSENQKSPDFSMRADLNDNETSESNTATSTTTTAITTLTTVLTPTTIPITAPTTITTPAPTTVPKPIPTTISADSVEARELGTAETTVVESGNTSNKEQARIETTNDDGISSTTSEQQKENISSVTPEVLSLSSSVSSIAASPSIHSSNNIAGSDSRSVPYNNQLPCPINSAIKPDKIYINNPDGSINGLQTFRNRMKDLQHVVRTVTSLYLLSLYKKLGPKDISKFKKDFIGKLRTLLKSFQSDLAQIEQYVAQDTQHFKKRFMQLMQWITKFRTQAFLLF